MKLSGKKRRDGLGAQDTVWEKEGVKREMSQLELMK